ncbi:MAG: thrombospondin type 3 repeat-containing protein [bacterium]
MNVRRDGRSRFGWIPPLVCVAFLSRCVFDTSGFSPPPRPDSSTHDTGVTADAADDGGTENDIDGDGVPNLLDNCPDTPNAGQANSDSDAQGDACDNCPGLSNPSQGDQDGDGVGDLCDNCPHVANPGQENSDSDALGDACDNCPLVYNPGQGDMDLDGVGDLCDNCQAHSNPLQQDADSDGFGNACDNCPTIPNDQTDSDSDGIGDLCDNCPGRWNPDQHDPDGDHVGTICDNCPATSNASQLDSDGDSRGDLCDNCVAVNNPLQEDTDGNGLGDACDPDDDGDTILDVDDYWPLLFNTVLFQDPLDGSGTGWLTAGGSWMQDTAGLHQLDASSLDANAWPGPSTWFTGEILVEVVATLDATAALPTAFGPIVRVQQIDAPAGFWWCALDPQGSLTLWRWVGGAPSERATSSIGSTLAPGTNVTIRLLAIGGWFGCELLGSPGAVVESYDSSALAEGGVGFHSTNAAFSAHSITVYDIPTGALPPF